MLYQVSLGLQYLRHRNVIHSDLKCDNILVGADGAVMLTDFGLSEMRAISKVPLPAKAVGAIRWKAREIVISGAAFSFKADVYSFAMCIVEAVTEDFPWGSLCDASVRYHLKRGMVLPKPSDRFTAEQWAFIQKMAAPAPSQRPQIEVVTAKLKLWADAEKYRDRVSTSSAKQRELIEQLCLSASPQTLSMFIQLLNSEQANTSVGKVDLKVDPAGAEQRSLVDEDDVSGRASSTASACTPLDSQEYRLSASLKDAGEETVATSAKEKSTAATDSNDTDAIAEPRGASDRQSERARGVTSHRACSACGGNVPVECNFCVYCGVTMATAC
ncbi:hypothetical protein BBJ28_00025499 [Nothophytophthora sp. Chile5]|nr:hypothetical protein BBJ28_00025499 [Nothophytophthora sp. Chile5]